MLGMHGGDGELMLTIVISIITFQRQMKSVEFYSLDAELHAIILGII